ncbi:MAG: long-chain fatty acid--CoA ligase [Salinarimonadaceae bacterium]|nr:MAG: long-chain fatty acid--CoA ligase [Salinarimonadaceae bacterium]
MNVGSYVARAARFFSERIAVIDGDRSVSFSTLEDRTNRLAHALAARGVRLGDRVAIILPNSLEWIEADFAVAKAGGMSVPITTRLHEREMAAMLTISETSAVITTPEILARLEPLVDVSAMARILVGPTGADGYEDAVAGASSSPICVEVDEARDGRVMRFTSGTTGKPKAVYLTHRNWIAVAHNTLLDRFNLQKGDVFLGTSPYAHAGGLWILPSLMRGATIRNLERLDPEALVALIEKGECTMLQLVPTALRRILDLPRIREADLSRLRAISYGGAPIEGSTLREALDVIGHKLVQGYGLNEAAIVCTLPPEEHGVALSHRGWQQPLGREVLMAEVAIMGPDGRPVPDGEVGEIAIRGPMVFTHYWKNPEATAQAIREGGYFWTGDLGLRGENGFIYIAGRSKDIIVTGGYNVSPDEVEAVVDQHPAVRQCAVVGLPDREWGETVTAFVILMPGAQASEADIIDFCRERLTSYKKPKAVRFVESLPVNSNGKVMRRLIRENLASE